MDRRTFLLQGGAIASAAITTLAFPNIVKAGLDWLSSTQNGVDIYSGIIKDPTIFFNPNSEFLIFNFNDLLSLRGGALFSQNASMSLDPSYQKFVLEFYASAIRQYASDVLNGDLGVWETVKEFVIKRLSC